MAATTLSKMSFVQTDRTSIEQIIYQFTKATSERNVNALDFLLHERFQTVQEDGVFSKLEWIKFGDQKMAGADEKTEVLHLHIAEKSASIKIKTSGAKGSTGSFVHLTKNGSGAWQILHILPYERIKV